MIPNDSEPTSSYALSARHARTSDLRTTRCRKEEVAARYLDATRSHALHLLVRHLREVLLLQPLLVLLVAGVPHGDGARLAAFALVHHPQLVRHHLDQPLVVRDEDDAACEQAVCTEGRGRGARA